MSMQEDIAYLGEHAVEDLPDEGAETQPDAGDYQNVQYDQYPAVPRISELGTPLTKAGLEQSFERLGKQIAAKWEASISAPLNITAPLTSVPLSLNVSTVLRRAGLSVDETRAVTDFLPAINRYLEQASTFANVGMSVGEFVESELADSVGVWTLADGAGLATQNQDPAFAHAMAKLDDAIRENYPRLSATGLLRY